MSDKPIRTARGFAARGVVERSSLDRLSAPAPAPVGATRTPELDPILSPEPDDASSSSWGIDTTPGWLTPEMERGPRLDGRERPRGNGFDDERRDDLDLDGDEEEDEDANRPRRRFAVAPAGAIALILVGVIACVAAGFGLLRSDDVVPTVAFPASAGPSASVPSDAAAPSVTAPAMPSTAAPSAAPAQIVVSVVGLVRKPGLVRLAPRSRVADALSSAGGAREGADTTSLNLAQVLGDGDQVLVGYASKDGNASLRSAVVAGVGKSDSSPATAGDTSQSGTGTTGPGSSNSTGGKVDLNTASAEQLDALPGVGPVTAKAIIDWRSQHGKFTSVDQLGEVDGIGPARLAKLRDLVTAG